jgi:exodeoxyribonuclease VII large subunit
MSFSAISQTAPTPVSVSDLTAQIKDLLEGEYAHVLVSGELSNYKVYSSGHHYFTLKDEGAQISGVMFRGFAGYMKFEPEDGMEVVLKGRVSVYERHGKYQIIAERMDPLGVGALQLAFEQLKKKLETEGLFAPERKKEIPERPARVGIITSFHGAAVHDMVSVIRRRAPSTEIVIFPVQVQGDLAAPQIATAIDYFSEKKSVDVLLVGRGGGSMEDLWAFNEEVVARAVSRCEIPIISAVGHETDFTICDFVADLRAPTPSVAAEMAVPDTSQDRIHLAKLGRSLEIAMKNLLSQHMYVLKDLTSRLPKPDKMWESWSLRVHHARKQLLILMKNKMESEKLNVKELNSLLRALSPEEVLKRGYALVKAEKQKIVTKAKDLKTGDRLEIIFQDGNKQVEVM